MKPATLSPLGRAVRALGYSLQGLAQTWREEQAFRHEVVLGSIALLLSLLVPLAWTQRALLLGATLFVLLVELLNSAVEAVVDHVSPDWHAQAKKAKDAGSAAVLLALLIWLLTWAAVLLPVLLG